MTHCKLISSTPLPAKTMFITHKTMPAFVFYGFFLIILIILAIPSVDSEDRTTFNLKATLLEESVAVLRNWIKKGGKTRIDIKPFYIGDLGLPEETKLCPERKQSMTFQKIKIVAKALDGQRYPMPLG